MGDGGGFVHGQFCWVDLASREMAGARKFYGDLFGWDGVEQGTQDGPPYALLTLEGKVVCGMGELNETMRSAGVPPTWNSYVAVDDADDVIRRATELGAQVTVPVMPVLDAGRLAFFQDPTGGHLGIWEKNKHAGAERVNDPGAFCWNELATRDADRAAEFFGKLFGWDYADNPHAPTKYHIIKNAGRDNGGIIEMNEQWGETPAHWMVYFSVADADAAAARVTELGGKVCVPPFDIPVGRLSVVNDPQGAFFTVIAAKQAG